MSFSHYRSLATVRQAHITEQISTALHGEHLNVPHYNHFDVTIDEDTARAIASSIARRDISGINAPFKVTLDDISLEFSNGDLNDSRDTIEYALYDTLLSSPESLLGAITDPTSRDELDTLLTTRTDRLGMTSGDYLRMLETILIAETPEKPRITLNMKINQSATATPQRTSMHVR